MSESVRPSFRGVPGGRALISMLCWSAAPERAPAICDGTHCASEAVSNRTARWRSRFVEERSGNRLLKKGDSETARWRSRLVGGKDPETARWRSRF